ncbi:MAG TPA: RDD family protein [Chryseosolibacter sp.]|nr:RDD family protein [Chryseosolibacter sp.]
MKSIEIKTAQNVILQYELADLRDRILAFLIDFVVVVIVIFLLASAGFGTMFQSDTAAAMYAIFLLCIFIFYSLAFETLNKGRSLGKMALRIQVIKAEGGTASFSDYAARWVFRMVDVYFSFGGIASILIASSAKAQRIGDIVANTAVVKQVPRMDLNLKDVLAIQTQESYKPEFVQAKQLAENDVLLIKATLDRYRRFTNPAHRDAIIMLADRIQEVLGVSNITAENRVQFLQTVLRDYVVLTR